MMGLGSKLGDPGRPHDLQFGPRVHHDFHARPTPAPPRPFTSQDPTSTGGGGPVLGLRATSAVEGGVDVTRLSSGRHKRVTEPVC